MPTAGAPAISWNSLFVRAVGWGAMTIAFTLLVVHYAINRGKLLVPAHYDDVTYLRDGLDKLDGFYRAGLPGILARVSLRPPHSPFSTAVAFAGYALFGTHDWAPYAANALVIAALLALVEFVTRGLPTWQRWACGLFVLTIPISAQAVYEFRADIWVGILTAAVIVRLLDQPLVRAPARYHWITGIIAGVTLLSKTSVFPITLGLCGSALLAASVRDRLLLGREASLAALGRAWGRILLPAFLIPLPYYVFNRREIYYYVTVNALGANQGVWSLHADRMTHLLYYATGEGARIMLGRHGLFLVAVLLAGSILLLPRTSKAAALRAAGYAFVLIVAYVGPTLNPIKDQFLAVTLDFVLIAVALMVLRSVLRGDAGPAWVGGANVVLVILLLAGAWSAKWPMYWGEPTRADVVARNRYMSDVYQAVRSHDPHGQAKVLVAVTGVFANADAFDYMAEKDALWDVDYYSDFVNRSLVDFGRWLDRSTFVVIGDPGNPEDDPNTPYSAMLDRTLAIVRGRPDYHLIATCPAMAGKNYYVFERAKGTH